MIEDNRRLLARAEAEAGRAETALAEAETSLARSEAALETAITAEAAATSAAARVDIALAEAEAARAAAEPREAGARAQRTEAESEAAALRAELGALTRLVDRDRGEGGHILDLVDVRPGSEKALGAALADDLRARPVAAAGQTGWLALPPYQAAPPLPEEARPLSADVTVPAELIRRIGQIGVVDRADGPRLQPFLQPGQRLVSAEGDLWRWDGFCARAEDAPSSAALRLQQKNRLAELRRDLDEAVARAATAADAHESLMRELAALTEADTRARLARRDADRLMAEASRARSRAEADRSIAEGRRDAARLGGARHAEDAAAARAALAEAEAALADLPDLALSRAALEEIRSTVETARATLLSLRSAHDGLRREGEARARRTRAIEAEIAGWQQRLATAARRHTELADRKHAAETELSTARAAPDALAARLAELHGAIAEAEARKARAADALSAAESALRAAQSAEREAERTSSEAREARARAETRLDAAREAVVLAEARILEEQDTTPSGLLNRLSVDPAAIPPTDAVEAQVAALRRQREALGAVNLRAEEDAREVQDEHDTLIREKTDLDDAIRALRTGIAGLNREGRERLLTAFEQVNENFRLLFTHLFSGGEARLVLVESDDPLEAGLEIMCQPPGKKLSTLSLLSGGEQTLTALALIFAVFLANPAPICVLDEVDAPLDDANVTRFCDLLDEMTRRTETRFMVITHHAVTMSRMDRLYGVTMGEQGVSQLVSVDLRRAEALVA
jgi:chromosome segregation protein